MTAQGEWWKRQLEDDYDSGRQDAENGVYEPPWPSSNDWLDQEQNKAYERGFNQRRIELGQKFKWT